MTAPDRHQLIDVKPVHIITSLDCEEVPSHRTVVRYHDFGVAGAIAVTLMGLVLLVGFLIVAHLAQHGGL